MTVVERAPTIEVDLLITGGLVVTMAPGRPIFEGGAVAISRGRIAMVGPAVDVGGSVRPRRIVEARRKIVLPGLIDAHAHAGHSLTKAIGAHFLRLSGPGSWTTCTSTLRRPSTGMRMACSQAWSVCDSARRQR